MTPTSSKKVHRGAQRRVEKTQPEDGEFRSPFEIDADRVLYAPEFRRLSGVTQVISPQDDYVFHDRLTHSLKVAQVAERLAQLLAEKFAKLKGISREEVENSYLNPKVCYVAGLCHDIGHPPFGHAAESELQSLLRSAVGFPGVGKRPILPDSFEGNAQSFRIVSRLSFRKAEHREPGMASEEGLNLTFRSLAAISKYPWMHGENPQNPKTSQKWGFYSTEKWYYDELVSARLFHNAAGSEGAEREPGRRSVEAEIMDWADDIAYAVHDLEDFYKSGRIPLHRLRYSGSVDTTPSESVIQRELQAGDGTLKPSDAVLMADDELSDDDGAERRNLDSGERVETPSPDTAPILAEAPPDSLFRDLDWNELLPFAAEKINRLSDETKLSFTVDELWDLVRETVVSNFPTAPFNGSRSSHAEIQSFASAMIRQLQDACEVVGLSPETLHLKVDPIGRIVAEFLKSITKFYVINDANLEAVQRGQRRVIRDIYENLFAMALGIYTPSRSVNNRRLPPRLVEYLDKTFSDGSADNYGGKEAAVARAIVDFICTLTDKQAALLHQRLTGDAVRPLSQYWLSI
ncbi:dGTP triphosphohydrolase [Agromyces sp. H66]|uniref:deoxyguanosinetriphosphate triphosphohydrolase family protein n=1 Tax=Agromyces sp. H66 TaxID=2529859 RepID=UPI0010AA411B|nr:dNTP triphosphohydrolase [Agromyces sp. H66]